MNAEEKKKLTTDVAEILKQRKSGAPRNVSMPFMENDVLKFEATDAAKLVVYHPATEQTTNGVTRTINEWTGIRLADGREISETQLCRAGNGLGLVGEDMDSRMLDFLALVQENGTLEIRILKSRIQPSTNPAYNGTRVISFAAIAR